MPIQVALFKGAGKPPAPPAPPVPSDAADNASKAYRESTRRRAYGFQQTILGGAPGNDNNKTILGG